MNLNAICHTFHPNISSLPRLQIEEQRGFQHYKKYSPECSERYLKVQKKKARTQLAQMSSWYQQLLYVSWARISKAF